jgi:hypothetical protein
MRGPLHVIRRRRAERPANEADAPSETEATTVVTPSADAADASTIAPGLQQPGAPTTEEPSAAGTDAAGPDVPAGQEPEPPEKPGFRHRGRVRRRLRYLRRVRELGFRDLGGLAFEQHKFSQVREDLVQAKLAALAAVDAELRALEHALADRRAVTELREPGISACPRCGALHGSDARFCPSCGVPLRGPRAVAGIGEGISTSVGEIGPVSPVPASQLSLLSPGQQPRAVPPAEPRAKVVEPPPTAAMPLEAVPEPPPADDSDQPTEIMRPDGDEQAGDSVGAGTAGERPEP